MKHNYEDLFKDQLEAAIPVTEEMISEMIDTRKQNYSGEELELYLKSIEGKVGKKILYYFLLLPSSNEKLEILKVWSNELESLDLIVKDASVEMSGGVPRFEGV